MWMKTFIMILPLTSHTLESPDGERRVVYTDSSADTIGTYPYFDPIVQDCNLLGRF